MELREIIQDLTPETKAELLDLLKEEAAAASTKEKEARKQELTNRLTETEGKPYLIAKRIKLKKQIADLKV